ncbi:MAG: type IV pili twitching motility protein PilT, partial [Erysipelotrichia bacterium]|nr:type IV pili twitching motility protein PilT [Erysipelotrichia bacterium]
MQSIHEILQKAVDSRASDIFIVAGLPVSMRKNDRIILEEGDILTPEDTRHLVEAIYDLTNGRDIEPLLTEGDDDFSFAVQKLSRFRVSAYKQRGSLSAVIRIISFILPNPKELGLPEQIIDLGNQTKGMI